MGYLSDLKTSLQVIQGHRAHKFCIVGKPFRRPFQRYLTWWGFIFEIYMTFGRWPDGVIRLSSVTNLTCNVTYTVDNRKPNCKIMNRSKVRAPTKNRGRTDGRTDGWTDGWTDRIVIPIKEFHSLIIVGLDWSHFNQDLMPKKNPLSCTN
jgi:hypothetical protein